MKIRGLCSEPILRYPRFIGDPQMKPAIWMRGPGRPVLCTQAAATSAGRDSRLGFWPVECDSNVSKMRTAADLAVGDRGRHLSCALCPVYKVTWGDSGT